MMRTLIPLALLAVGAMELGSAEKDVEVHESSQAPAMELRPDLVKMAAQHPRLLDSLHRLNELEAGLRRRFTVFFPQLSLGARWDREKTEAHPTNANRENSNHSTSIVLDQLLFDFGESFSDIAYGRLLLEEAEAAFEVTLNNVLHEMISSALRYELQKILVEHDRSSEQNFLKQKEIEASKVDRGQGFATDVLQVEVQGMGASARVVQSELALEEAQQTFERWWGSSVPPRGFLEQIEKLMKGNPLPETLQGVRSAWKCSPAYRRDFARLEAKEKEGRALLLNRFTPSLRASLEHRRGEELAGLGSHEKENSAALVLSFPLQVASYHEWRANQEQEESLRWQLRDLELELTQELARSWQRHDKLA